MDYEIFDNMLNRIVTLSIDVDRARTERDSAERKASAIVADCRIEVADVFNLMSSMAGGRTIEAIKAYRTLTGAGLKEAKDAVESVMDRERELP